LILRWWGYERAVVLGRNVNNDRFVIDAYGIYDGGRALGWYYRAQKNSLYGS